MLRERGITIGSLMQYDIMKDAVMAAGQNGASRIITGANIMEVPDILDWVKPGELLITTAYSIRDDTRAQRNLIPLLNSKGLAGIAIKTKRYLERIPSIMVEEANKLGFPVIELPYELSFSDLMNTILLEVYNRQSDVLMKMDEIHKKITDVVLSGGGLKEIGSTLYGIIKNPIVIKDNIFSKSVAIASDEERLILEKEIKSVIKGKNTYTDLCIDVSTEEPCKKCNDRVQGKEIYRCIFPIVAGKRLYGEIHIWEETTEITGVDVRAIQYACAVVALELMKQMTIFEVESRHKNEFLEGLLSSEEKIRSEAIEKAEIFGLDADYQYAVFLIYIDNLQNYFYDSPGENGTQFKNKLIKTIEAAVKHKEVKPLSGCKGNTLTIILAFKDIEEGKCIKDISIEMVSGIIDAIKLNYNDISSYTGIGRCYAKLDDLYKSYEESKKALSFARIFNNDKLVHYDNLGIFRLLCMEHQESEIRRFYTETVEPLSEYDEQKDGELIKTLKMYFECGGNLKRVSEKMYIHYNTILYRIHKIEQITKLDLSNSSDRLNLEVSLKIMSIINETPFSGGFNPH